MGSDESILEAISSSSSSTPKLSIFSLPNHHQQPPGMLTPPLQRPASIPFLWEEKPGKPRFDPSSSFSSTITNKCLAARCLELPPRLISSQVKITETSSPTTVLDGPCPNYVRRCSSHSTVFARERLTSFEDMGSITKTTGYFGTSWGKKSRNIKICEGNCGISPCSSSFRSDNPKVKITRITRTGSFLFRLPSSKTHRRHTHHILASICGTIKQVVPLPWRSRKIKKESISDSV